MRMKFFSRHVGCRTLFLTVLRFIEKIMNCFQIRHNFQLAYNLIFQKSNICPKKQLNIKKLFKKMWSKVSLFSSNFHFGAQLYNENFKISNPIFSHVIYNKQKKVEKQEKIE
jgi:hypothetical protein